MSDTVFTVISQIWLGAAKLADKKVANLFIYLFIFFEWVCSGMPKVFQINKSAIYQE